MRSTSSCTTPPAWCGSALRSAGAQVAAAVDSLLGPLAASVDLPSHAVRVQGGDGTSGRFGWHADVSASPTALGGQLRFGPDAALPTVGGLQLQLDLNPLRATLLWHQPGGRSDTVALWPAPDAAGPRPHARAGSAQPGRACGARADAPCRRERPTRSSTPMLDALGLLGGTVGDAERALRPLAGLLSDPAGWLRSAGSLAASPVKIQDLFDALRPLMGLNGGSGTPLALANGVSARGRRPTAVAHACHCEVDPSGWTAPSGVTSRLAGGIGATLGIRLAGPPSVGLEAYVGLARRSGGPAGRLHPDRQRRHRGVPAPGRRRRHLARALRRPRLAGRGGRGCLAVPARSLAEIPGTPGDLVRTVGDAFALRSGAPAKFSGDALRAWAANPVGALAAAVPSIIATGLNTIAPLLDDFLPAAVSASATLNRSASRSPASRCRGARRRAACRSRRRPSPCPASRHSASRSPSAPRGWTELSVTIGPAQIDAGGVMLRPFVSIARASPRPAAGAWRSASRPTTRITSRRAGRWTRRASTWSRATASLAAAIDSTDPGQVALRIVEVVADLVAAVAMAQQPVQDLLDTEVGRRGRAQPAARRGAARRTDPAALIDGLFDPATLLARIHRLFANIADAGITIRVEDLAISFTSSIPTRARSACRSA